MGGSFLIKLKLSTDIALLYKINVGSGLFPFPCAANALNVNIGLPALVGNDLDMFGKVDLCLKVVGGGSINGLFSPFLH
jgi:hypothetical protein